MDYNRRTNRIINNQTVYSKRETHIYDYESLIPIGKFKGRLIKDILEIDFFYLDYMRKQGALLLSFDVRKHILDKKKEYYKTQSDSKRQEYFDKHNKKRAENLKRRQEDKAKRNPKTTQPIYLFDKDKRFIKRFKSRKECAKELGCSSASFFRALKDKQLFLKKYHVGYSQSTYDFF